ncbi:MAG: PAS domain S-box protein [Kofleriaceae bacterium]|nr:PAS domain S-box protein [Kofleriaceae bacterium]
MRKDPHVIALVGGAEQWAQRRVDALREVGLIVVRCHSLGGLPAAVALVVLCDDDPAERFIEYQSLPDLQGATRLAVIADTTDDSAGDVLRAGADDVIALNAAPSVFVARCINLLRLPRSDGGFAEGVLPNALLRVNELLTQRGDEYAALVAALLVIAETLRFERASLVAHVEGSQNVFVIAANDAPTRSRFAVDIRSYPEIAETLRTNLPVLIDDVLTDPIMAGVRGNLAGRGVRGVAVLPVQWRGQSLGVLMLRGAKVGVGHLRGRGLELARLIASITAAHLRHSAVLESLREQAHNLSPAHYEAERRLRGILALQEHFESGSDGVVVLDDHGRILFVNRAAERIIGYERDGLVGSALAELIPEAQRPLIATALEQVLSGTNLDPFDVPLGHLDQIPIWVSVSTSTVLAGSGAVILVFRDVSAERAMAQELGATKEFLERLIDSTVDAIIAADMRGNVLLFNEGAERLFGYAAEDVIGQFSVGLLYDEGVAKQVMRMLRSTAYGGVGRLEQTRRQIVTRAGEIVPISLTASIVYDGEAEVASVGILTDLRERIRMEQRLLDAQQKLQTSERQAMVAELAGAAAHELNQPLTSIMGYAQLIQRQSPVAAPHLRAVGIILAEAERMADIVRKVGRITKYETTSYVGSTRIFDLDRAAAEPEPAAVLVGAAPPEPEFEESTGEFEVGIVGKMPKKVPVEPEPKT